MALGVPRRRDDEEPMDGWLDQDHRAEFKDAIAAPMKTEPDLCVRLRFAIKATAARGGVHHDVRDQYLLWIAVIESATTGLACRPRSARVRLFLSWAKLTGIGP